MGAKTRFPRTPSWDNSITRRRFAARFPELHTIQLPFDPKLASMWADLRDFSLAADAAIATHTKIPAKSFTNISELVPYRLFSVRYSTASLLELVRLSMAAYVKTILIRTKGVGPKMVFLATELRDAILLHSRTCSPSQYPFLFWAVSMAAISIFEDCEEDWLRTTLTAVISSLGLRTWLDARNVLGNFLWTDAFHSVEGKQLFEQCLQKMLTEGADGWNPPCCDRAQDIGRHGRNNF